MNQDDYFDGIFGKPKQSEREAVTQSLIPAHGTADAKLAQNLDLALTRQGELLVKPIDEDTSPRERRIVADVSNQVVRVAVGVDEQRFRPRADDILKEILAALAIEKAKLGPLLDVDPCTDLDLQE